MCAENRSQRWTPGNNSMLPSFGAMVVLSELERHGLPVDGTYDQRDVQTRFGLHGASD